MKYYIVEEGEYSDYRVSIYKAEDINLSIEDLNYLLSINKYDNGFVSGVINGEVTLFGDSCLPMNDLEAELREKVNRLFACYPNKKTETVLDKLRTKEELIEIAIGNDNSGILFWKSQIEQYYNAYKKAFNCLTKK